MGTADRLELRTALAVAPLRGLCINAAHVLAMLVACICLALVRTPPALAQTDAADAAEPPLSIAIFVSSRRDQCYDNGILSAITHLTRAEQRRINSEAGVRRRRIELQFYDDALDDKRAIENVRQALANTNTIAMIGLSSSNRAKAVFDSLSSEIGASGIPFLSDISVNSLFEKQTNVFTMRPSQDDERVPVMAAFIKARNIKRLAFVGLEGVVFSSSLGDGLKAAAGTPLVADHRLSLKDDKIDPAAIAATVADLKEKNPDLIAIAIGSSRTAELMKALVAADFTPPLFITGRIETVIEQYGKEYPGDLFQLGWDNLPDMFSDRLRERIARNGLDRWIFEGERVAEAPGWSTGECKVRPEAGILDVFAPRNMIAIGRGTQYADMVALVGESLKTADARADTKQLRSHVLKQLTTNYVAGRGAFRGSFENWSFRRSSRSADRTPVVVMRPNGLGASQLAPEQFLRLKNEGLRKIDTLYLDIDLVRLYRIDDGDKSFFADFYVAMRGNNASLDRVEFVNAFLDPKTNDRQITVRTLHQAGPSDVYPSEMNIYLVSGKFTFEPRLADYPFDNQRFAINIQPKSGDAPFIIQPPPNSLRDKTVDTDGWTPTDQYVGYDEDFVPTIDAWTFQRSIVPFYKASFAWLMQRQTTDYYLRVVVPLAFILAVTYMSIFIPMSHFEAIVTIQVTALLSAVALYLALPKVDAGDSTTMSDKIFLFIYTAVSLMIVVSILRVSKLVTQRKWIRRSLTMVHIVLIPVLVALMALYVYRTGHADGSTQPWPWMSAAVLQTSG